MRSVSIPWMAFLLIGCGLDKKDLSNIRLLNDNERVDYQIHMGKYDLAEYLVPNENQIHTYRIQKYRKAGGDYQTPFRVNNSSETKYIVEGDIVKEGLNITYIIEDFNITKQEIVNGFYDNRNYRRFVDANDTYYSYEHVDNATTLYQVGWVTCKVEEHNESKKILGIEYRDILTLICTSEAKEGVRGEFSEKTNYTMRKYVAKNIGEIGAIGEECKTKSYNSVYKSCIKTKKELQKIIKEN